MDRSWPTPAHARSRSSRLQLAPLPLHEAAWLFLAVMVVILLAPIIARLMSLPELATFVLVGMVAGPGVLGLLEREGRW